METPGFYVGLDVGGTAMKGGVVEDSGRPLSSISLPTEAHKGQEFGLARMCETIQAAVKSAGLQISEISAIGVATPGTMDIPAGIILDPPNLRPWQNMPVRDPIQDRFKVPTAFQNDANAAAMGEFWVGAGKDLHSLVLYTLGTGVGGGIIIGGEVVQGEHSHGAELGHVRIEMTNPRRCGCGRMGCLEAYASATAVLKRTREALAQDSNSRLNRNGDFTAKDVFDAAALGDALAEKIVEETAFYLAVGTVNMMHTIDPDVVAFAGGMIAAGEGFLQRIRRYVLEMAFPVPAAKTKILYAKLGSDAGFIGAAACGRQAYFKSLKRDGAE
ncbi:MAG: ROK family protein [Gemmataceae bacterium]